MTNEIMVRGTQEFMGIEIPVIEGGFGEGCKCVTDKTVSEIHDIPAREIRRIIKDNSVRFKKGIDVIDLLERVGDTHTLDLTKFGYAKQSITQAKNIFLLSERGYAKLIKIMDSDKAWEIHDCLMDEYFAMRNVINSNEQLKAQLLLQIYDGGQDAVIASRELVEMETIPLRNTIAQQNQLITEYEPKVTYYDEVLKSNSAMTITSIAKDYGMSGRQLNKILHDEKVQYKMGETWLLYQNYARNGYTKSETICLSNGSTTLNTKWTQKGRLFIYELLKNKCGIIPLIERE